MLVLRDVLKTKRTLFGKRTQGMPAAHEKHVTGFEERLLVKVRRTRLAERRIDGEIKVSVPQHRHHLGESVVNAKANAGRLLAELHDERNEQRVERVVDRHDPHDALGALRVEHVLLVEECVGRSASDAAPSCARSDTCGLRSARRADRRTTSSHVREDGTQWEATAPFCHRRGSARPFHRRSAAACRPGRECCR